MYSHSGCTAPRVWCGEYVYSIWTDWAFGCQKPLSVTLCYDDWSNNNLWWAPSSSAVNLTLIAFAAECWHLQHDAHSASAGIDQYLLPAWCSAANPPATVAVAVLIDGTDRCTPDRYIDPAPHTMWAVNTVTLFAECTDSSFVFALCYCCPVHCI